MASLTQWTWVWASYKSWWWTGRPGMLQPMGCKELDMTEWLYWAELEEQKETSAGNGKKLTCTEQRMYSGVIILDSGRKAWHRLYYWCLCLCCALSPSPVWLFATSKTVAHQAPLSIEIFQARMLEWVGKPSSRASSQPRDRTQVSHIEGRFFTIWATKEAWEYWRR